MNRLERGRILSVLGVRIQEIEHVGSTAAEFKRFVAGLRDRLCQEIVAMTVPGDFC